MPRRFGPSVYRMPGDLRLGQRVTLIVDRRQEGEIIAMFTGETPIRVKWDGTGWKSDHALSELERI